MEAAKPILFKTPSESLNEEKIDFIEELTSKKNNEEYKIQFGIKENQNYLVIKSFSVSSKNMIYYQQSYNINELLNLSKIFTFYETIKEIISFLKNLKIDIEEQKDELKIKFEAFLPNGESKIIEFNLKQHLMNTNYMIKYLLSEIKIMKENMNKEIANLKNKHESDIKELKENNIKFKKEVENLKEENKKLFEEINSFKKILEKSKSIKENDISDLNSKILNTTNSINFILDYIRLNDKEFNFSNIKLLYRGSRDGDRTKTCHKLCDNKQNVLIMILSDTGYIFGGYSKIGFQTNNNNNEYKIDNNSFLFSVNLKKIYPVIKNSEAICYIPDRNGLCFRASLGFYDGFMNNSSGRIFSNDNLEFFSKPSDKYEMNGSKDYFKCRELEVFQLL